MGLYRSWTVAWPLTDATVYCVLSGGITVCWGHRTFFRYFEAVVEVGMLRIGRGDCFCSWWQVDKTLELHTGFFCLKDCNFSTSRWSNLGKGQRNSDISRICMLKFPREELVQSRSYLLLQVSTGKLYSWPLFSSHDSWSILKLWFLELYNKSVKSH